MHQRGTSVAVARQMTPSALTREQLATKLKEDLAREYQAVISCIVCSQELQHAITIAKHIDYLGGPPTVQPPAVKMLVRATELLRADLDNENNTVIAYRERVRQCEALSEFAIAEDIREILRQR